MCNHYTTESVTISHLNCSMIIIVYTALQHGTFATYYSNRNSWTPKLVDTKVFKRTRTKTNSITGSPALLALLYHGTSSANVERNSTGRQTWQLNIGENSRKTFLRCRRVLCWYHIIFVLHQLNKFTNIYLFKHCTFRIDMITHFLPTDIYKRPF